MVSNIFNGSKEGRRRSFQGETGKGATVHEQHSRTCECTFDSLGINLTLRLSRCDKCVANEGGGWVGKEVVDEERKRSSKQIASSMGWSMYNGKQNHDPQRKIGISGCFYPCPLLTFKRWLGKGSLFNTTWIRLSELGGRLMTVLSFISVPGIFNRTRSLLRASRQMCHVRLGTSSLGKMKQKKKHKFLIFRSYTSHVVC